MSLHVEGCAAYLAPDGFEAQLAAELHDVRYVQGRLHVAPLNSDGTPQRSFWAQNVWLEPRVISFRSIGDAARQLKSLQRNWWPYQTQLFRRAELIQQQLPHVSAKPLAFPTPLPTAPLGSWMLLGENTMLASARCSSPFPNGEPAFEEFKVEAPSRAYLKMFEALTLLGCWPGPGDKCLELGASPGGWTWVLTRLGAHVTALDRSELDPALMQNPLVSFVKGDAFAAKPERYGQMDWLVSDVICYPEKLYEFVQLWLASGQCKNFVCTLKFQGDAHYGITESFASVPGSRVMHLAHNKHELTWALVRDS